MGAINVRRITTLSGINYINSHTQTPRYCRRSSVYTSKATARQPRRRNRPVMFNAGNTNSNKMSDPPGAARKVPGVNKARRVCPRVPSPLPAPPASVPLLPRGQVSLSARRVFAPRRRGSGAQGAAEQVSSSWFCRPRKHTSLFMSRI